MYLSLPR